MIPRLSIGPRTLLNDCNHSATAIFWRSAILRRQKGDAVQSGRYRTPGAGVGPPPGALTSHSTWPASSLLSLLRGRRAAPTLLLFHHLPQCAGGTPKIMCPLLTSRASLWRHAVCGVARERWWWFWLHQVVHNGFPLSYPPRISSMLCPVPLGCQHTQPAAIFVSWWCTGGLPA